MKTGQVTKDANPGMLICNVCLLFVYLHLEKAGGEVIEVQQEEDSEAGAMELEPDKADEVPVSTTYSRNKRKLITSPFMDKDKLKAMNVDYGIFYG